MKKVSMSGSLRENVGKKDAKKQRSQGRVPCVIYGGEEQLHFTLDEKEFNKLIFTPETYLVELTIDDKQCMGILQDVQYHPVSDNVLHADFLEVYEGKPVITALPVKFNGNPKGVLRGGRLVRKFRKLKVKGQVEKMPDLIEIDISNLLIGQSVLIRDLERENLTFLDPGNSVVVGVRTARVLLDEVEEEEEGEEGEEGEGEEGEGSEGGEEGEKSEEN